MRIRLLSIFLLLSGVLMAQPPQGPLIVSPEIHADNTVTFRILAPQATEVQLEGQFSDKLTPMTKDQQGIWSTTVGPVKPDIYPYCFRVDQVNVADPANPRIFANERFKHSLLSVPGNPPLIHELQDVPHGNITYRFYQSKTLHCTRQLVIYTPPGFNPADKKKYPVLYLIHGGSDTEETWTKVGNAHLIADNLIAQGKAEPMIIVMPYGNVRPAAMRDFTNDVLNDIIPFTESQYPVLGQREFRAIAGFSVGGGQTLNIGLSHPELFGSVCAFAPYTATEEFRSIFTENWLSGKGSFPKQPELFTISVGTSDFLYESVKQNIAYYKAKGMDVKSFICEGGHTWMNCRKYLSRTLQQLFKKDKTSVFCSGIGNKPDARYPSIFLQSGYTQKDIDQKLTKAWQDLFEGPDRIYFEVGDSMGFVSDLKNHDARTEGLSYGMMIAVQLNQKEVFDRIWRFSKKYLQHQEGPREGYFAWSINPWTLQKNAEGSATDGELYYITSLLFASNRWGNSTGIDYYREARRILDASWKKDGTGNVQPLINKESKQICFVPEGFGYTWTDPSYHLPAFMEIWARYAKDGHEDFYRACADTSRAFLHRACHPVTGLNADYTSFDGTASRFGRTASAFRYDSWRVPMNIAMDFNWYHKDADWQKDYANRIQMFLQSRGLNTFEDQFNTDGSLPEQILQAGGFRKLRHSLGLLSTAASTTLVHSGKDNAFVHALWDARLEPYEDGYFDPYYDGLLYLFSLLHLSGNYRIISPQ